MKDQTRNRTNVTPTQTVGLMLLAVVGTWWAVGHEPEIREAVAAPQGVISTIRKAEAIIDRANETLDDFESKGVIVKPAEPAEQLSLVPDEPPVPWPPAPELAECADGSCSAKPDTKPTKPTKSTAPASCGGGVCRPRLRLFRRCR